MSIVEILPQLKPFIDDYSYGHMWLLNIYNVWREEIL